MKFALFTSMGNTSWDELRTLWDYAEAAGWDAACVTDHFMPNTADRVGDTIECWTALAALATTTKRMRIGTIVTGNTYRHPAVLAKMAANVDIISGGRLICGMGAGWQENEHRAYGIEFYTVRERLDRLDEACRVLKALWTESKASFKGRYYQLEDAPLMPKPVQRPYPELMIGGGGEKVTLLTVARYVSPKGTAIHGQGVQPTVAVGPGPDDGPQETEAPAPGKDKILDKALELLRSGEAKKAA